MITAAQTYLAPSLQPLSFVMQAKPNETSGADTDKPKPSSPLVMTNSAEEYTKALTASNPVYGVTDDDTARLIKPLPLTEAVTDQLTTLYNSVKPDTEVTETVEKSV